MADFTAFTEGKNNLANSGLPATCTFDLSTKTVEELGASATYAGGFAKATGTGYAAQSQSEPTAEAGEVKFAKMTWETGTAEDWPISVKSVVLRNGTSNLICAWNLQAGGAGRAMNAKNTVENFTPTLVLT